MATKPASVPSWATDTNYASGDQIGESTKLEPASGYKAQGCVPGSSAPGRYMNWLWNLLCAWTAYLDDLHNSAEFLNKSYTWVGAHIFSSFATFSSIATFNGGILSTGASISSAGGEYAYGTPRTRTVLLPFRPFSLWSQGDLSGVAEYVRCSTNLGVYKAPIQLPRGVTMTQVQARWNKGSAGGTESVRMRLWKHAVPLTSGGATVVTSMGAEVGPTASGDYLATVAMSEVIDNSANLYVVEIVASDTAATLYDQLNSIRVTYDDPGPRNG